MVDLPIYLDNHATTRPDPRVVDAMMPYFTTIYGNAASVSHSFGWAAAEAVEEARTKVAAAIGAEAREIVFTSGASEANNLALKGVTPSLRKKGNHLITSAAEHKSVLESMKRLAREGWDVTILPPDEFGMVSVESVRDAITDKTVLVSIMAANNEVGTLNPVSAIGKLCKARGILFHTDATQAVGKVAIDVHVDGIDLLSLTAHKIYGPKGIGALYIRRSGESPVRIAPMLDGGGHERGIRSGTVPVPLVVGFGRAVEIAVADREEETARVYALRERLHDGISQTVDEIHLNGHPTNRLPGNLNLSFAYVDGEALMMAMKNVAVSSGSACTSANPEPSHVLRAIGLDDDMARASLRFGLGRYTTQDEVDFAINAVGISVSQLRKHSAVWADRAAT